MLRFISIMLFTIGVPMFISGGVYYGEYKFNDQIYICNDRKRFAFVFMILGLLMFISGFGILLYLYEV